MGRKEILSPRGKGTKGELKCTWRGFWLKGNGMGGRESYEIIKQKWEGRKRASLKRIEKSRCGELETKLDKGKMAGIKTRYWKRMAKEGDA